MLHILETLWLETLWPETFWVETFCPMLHILETLWPETFWAETFWPGFVQNIPLSMQISTFSKMCCEVLFCIVYLKDIHILHTNCESPNFIHRLLCSRAGKNESVLMHYIMHLTMRECIIIIIVFGITAVSYQLKFYWHFYDFIFLAGMKVRTVVTCTLLYPCICYATIW